MISFSVLTLGCKVNSYESEALINKLIDKGYELKNFNEVCDIYIVNSCTVTSTSDQKSRQMLHAARRRNSDAVVVVMGCYSQLNSIAASKDADIVIGTNNKLDVVELIESYLGIQKFLGCCCILLTGKLGGFSRHSQYRTLSGSHNCFVRLCNAVSESLTDLFGVR